MQLSAAGTNVPTLDKFKSIFSLSRCVCGRGAGWTKFENGGEQYKGSLRNRGLETLSTIDTERDQCHEMG